MDTIKAAQVHDRTGMLVSNISVEEWRTYTFPDGYEYHINSPRKLWIKSKPEGDSHRVLDDRGIVHYIPAGWRIVRWKGEVIA